MDYFPRMMANYTLAITETSRKSVIFNTTFLILNGREDESKAIIADLGDGHVVYLSCADSSDPDYCVVKKEAYGLKFNLVASSPS